MSIFDFPRINLKGLLEINVGTANNDDYSKAIFPEGSPGAGLPLRLSDSVLVKPLTYGMNDEEFMAWAQKTDKFLKPVESKKSAAIAAPAEASGENITRAERSVGVRGSAVAAGDQQEFEEVKYIPAEWNYYGDMGLTFHDMRVLAIQHKPGSVITDPAAGDPAAELIGAELSFKNRPGDTGRSTGMLIDVNAEDVPCSQVFSDSLLLEKDGEALFLGKPSKAVTRWINFQRTAGLNGPNGAAGTFQCVVPIEELNDAPILKIMPSKSPTGRPLKGIVFRYVIYRCLQPINTFKYSEEEWFSKIEELYTKKGLNPDIGQVVGTISPWFEDDMASLPTGRLLNPTTDYDPPKNGFPVSREPMNSKNKCFYLAPAVLVCDEQRGVISLDLATALPDEYTDEKYDPYQTGYTGKLDFGEIRLRVRSGDRLHDFGAIPYQDTAAGDRRGWIFEFPLSAEVRDLVRDGLFTIHHPTYGELLTEQEYFIASDQSCIYTEQGSAGSVTNRFLNESGTEERATIRLFHKGEELVGDNCPTIAVWEYDSTPNQKPGNRKCLRVMKPGDELEVEIDRPGNRLYTFALDLDGRQEPPEEYGKLNLLVVPMINLRILPNDHDKDYNQYYVDPQASKLVGNEKLTFAVIYEEVLRNYYLLYPGMNQRIPLNDPDWWQDPEMAGRLFQRTQTSWWSKADYMPRTRDLSSKRRELLHAWAWKVMAGNS